jgi:hypothetical protein
MCVFLFFMTKQMGQNIWNKLQQVDFKLNFLSHQITQMKTKGVINAFWFTY